MGNLTREQARKQAKRLLANAMLTPQSDDGIAEIIDCLMRHCNTAEHAGRTMTEFLDSARDPRNVTAEIAAAAERVAEPVKLPEGCDTCRYVDESGATGYRPHVVVANRCTEALGRCSCARGRTLLATDRKRDADQRERMASRGLAS